MERFGKDHSKLQLDLEGAGVRVERVEREMDYIETQNPPKPCTKAQDKMVEQEGTAKQDRKKDELITGPGEGTCVASKIQRILRSI